MYYISWLLIRIQTNHLKTANDDIALIRVHLINKSCYHLGVKDVVSVCKFNVFSCCCF